MKDAIGRELIVGDKVMFCTKWGNSAVLIHRVVTEIEPKKGIRVKGEDCQRPGWTFSDRVIKVTDIL